MIIPDRQRKASEACRNFCLELKNTIEYMKLNGVLQNEPAQITVTGGGSLFIPLRKELENYFSSPVEVLDLIRSKQLEIEENIRSQLRPANNEYGNCRRDENFRWQKVF